MRPSKWMAVPGRRGPNLFCQVWAEEPGAHCRTRAEGGDELFPALVPVQLIPPQGVKTVGGVIVPSPGTGTFSPPQGVK